jgi:hypothetical protein
LSTISSRPSINPPLEGQEVLSGWLAPPRVERLSFHRRKSNTKVLQGFPQCQQCPPAREKKKKEKARSLGPGKPIFIFNKPM